jgi:protein-L-isoaspartate(D-aspartate) O-methyltransferase
MIVPFAEQRLNMVEGQIKPFSVADRRVLNAFAAVPREVFVPENRRGIAYLGEDLPMGEGRFLIEPSIYARLIQEAAIESTHHVLDAGCLTGYTSCILANLAAYVTAIDQQKWLDSAKEKAAKLGFSNIDFIEAAKQCETKQLEAMDVIVINGAVEIIPDNFKIQLKEGGRISTFIRTARGGGHAVLYHKHKGALHEQILFDAFVPLFPGFEKAEGFVF